MEISGEAIRTRLECCDCNDYEELILTYIADKLGYEYNYLKDNVKVELKPADNQRIIEFCGSETILYDLMVELSNFGYEPITRYPILSYTYDLLHKRNESSDGINNEEKEMLDAINKDYIMRMNNIHSSSVGGLF